MASMKGIPLSKVSPAFLHANSTSHTWVFSAFAEIIDNAYDPDVSASELLIDKVDIRGVPCLIFLDNGAGMDADHLLKMLSFGFCEKAIYEKQGSHQPIGHYGNGFKSGSMRIGKDALVFTRCPKSASIGFLSQTYLKSTQADCVMVPILEYRLPSLERIKSQESRNNLNAILHYSVFKLESELKEELKALEGSKTGTKIILYNLKKLQDNTSELDFASDPTDIRCPEAHEVDATSVYHRPIQQNASEYKRSLREYCSILFLRPRMKITIRGVRVKSKLISKSLSNTEIDMYKPTWLSRPVKIIFGFACDSQRPEDSDYGMMLYHRNRLIKAFEKVGYQRQPNDLGVGVVGVAQVDFLQPIHNKQDFNKDEKFNSVMSAFANKLNDYWNEKKGSNSSAQSVVRNLPDWLWAQCEHCLKWRRLLDEVDPSSLPEQWFCRMNTDATHNRCDVPEEPEDEDLAVKPTYEKTFKKKQEERKRLQQLEKEQEENMKRRKIMEKEQELKEKEAALRAIQQVAAAQPLQENRAVVSLQKALAEARRREEQQKRLILQIQEQKKAILEQRNSLLQMAETLQSGEEMNGEKVFQQMSQFFNNLGPQFAASTPGNSPSSKAKSEDSQPMHNGKRKRKVSLKTETEELVSVTENDIEVDVDVEFEDVSPPAKNPGKQNRVTKQNAPAIKAETERKSLKQHQNSPAVTNSSRTPATRNGKQLTPVASPSKAPADVRAVSTSASPAVSKGKRQRRGAVVDVIDLTDESELCEVMDVKPSVAEVAKMAPDGVLDPAAKVKPEKQVLDEVLTNKDNQTEVTPKQEICETTSQMTTASPPKEKTDTANRDAAASESAEGINFGPECSESLMGNPESLMGNPESLMGNPESFQDNLEAAIAAIQDRMEKENIQQESHLDEVDDKDGVIKDEVRDENIKNYTDAAGREKEVEAGTGEAVSGSSDSPESDVHNETDAAQLHSDECEQDMDTENEDTAPILTFNDLLQAEENDDHASNALEDKRSGAGNYSVINDGDGGSFNYCDAADGESADQDDVESSHYSTTGQEEDSESVDAVEEAVLESSSSELHEKVIASLSSGLTEAENVTDSFLEGSDRAGSQTGKLSDEQEENIVSTGDTLRDNTSPCISDSSCEDAVKLSEKSCKEDVAQTFTAEDSLRSENIPEQTSVHSEQSPAADDDDDDDDDIVSCEDPRDESVEVHLYTNNTPVHSEDPDKFSSYNLSQSAIEESVTIGECTRNTDSNDDTASSNDKHELVNPSGNNKTILKKCEDNKHKLKSTCDQQAQTDIDMAAVESVFKQRDNTQSKMLNSNSKDVQSTEEVEKNQNSYKSSRVTNLMTNSEAQTNITLCQNNQKGRKIVKNLHREISVKTELLEKMEARLVETYTNVHKLLGFIVPSAELGDISSIHQVVKDMVKCSEASSQPILKGGVILCVTAWNTRY